MERRIGEKNEREKRRKGEEGPIQLANDLNATKAEERTGLW